MDKKYLTVKEAAEYIGVHPQTLRNWDREGILRPAYRTPKKQRRYTREQLNEFLKEMGNKEES